MHEICKIIGPQQSHRYLKDIVIDIMKTKNKEVLVSFIKNIEDLFNSFKIVETTEESVETF